MGLTLRAEAPCFCDRRPSRVGPLQSPLHPPEILSVFLQKIVIDSGPIQAPLSVRFADCHAGTRTTVPDDSSPAVNSISICPGPAGLGPPPIAADLKV